jgi:hypothetical protein
MKTYIKNLFLLPALIAGLGLIPAGRVTAQIAPNLVGSTLPKPAPGALTNALTQIIAL